MDIGRRTYLALAGAGLTVLAGCTGDETAPTDATTAAGATTATTRTETTTSATTRAETTTGRPTATVTDEPPATATTDATATATAAGARAPTVQLLNVISNEGEYVEGDVEREAVDSFRRGRRVALAARYRITVHDGSVGARFVMTIEDPEGFVAEYPPDDRSANGLESGYNQYEYHREFATDEFRPGEYTATLDVTDRITGETGSATTTFTVTE